MPPGSRFCHPLAALAGALLTAVTACSAPAPEDTIDPDVERPVNWKMASTYSSSLALLGTGGKRIADRINVIAGGAINIKFHEPGALAPAFEVFDAVSYGAIEAAWSTPGYWAGKVPALQMFAAIPFGPGAGEYLAWVDHGGGREIFEELYHAQNIHSVICGLSPPEASGWFRQPITSVDDFEGLKIRFFGLGAKVMDRIGASTQLLAAGDIFQALELGTIDATEFSMPVVDLDLGFYQAAQHYYFPGWHQQTTLFELMINLDVWKALSARQQAIVETACGANIRAMLSEGEAMQFRALQTLQSKGVTLHKWSPEMLAIFEENWLAVAAEMSEENPDFRRTLESLNTFRENYRLWHDYGYLK